MMIAYALALGLAVLLAGVSVVAEECDALVARGRQVFTHKGCLDCHTVGAVGTPIASDLSRVGFRYTESTLAQWLKDPSAQRPTRHMPKIELSEAEVEALAAYLASLQ